MTVILPQETKTQIGMKGTSKKKKHPVLYLLHGLSDDHTIWLRRTSIERYVSSLGLAVVMPAVGRSFYSDMKHGLKYWSFVSSELPEIARSLFPLSESREDNFAAGLSMGGYGAFKLAFSCPEKFCAAASLSGSLDAEAFTKRNASDEALNIFGDKIAGTESDLFYLSKKLASDKKNPKPNLFQWCGTEDFLYKDNLRFRNHLEELKYDLHYDEGKGDHSWAHWDIQIQKVLEWLVKKGKLKG